MLLLAGYCCFLGRRIYLKFVSLCTSPCSGGELLFFGANFCSAMGRACSSSKPFRGPKSNLFYLPEECHSVCCKWFDMFEKMLDQAVFLFISFKDLFFLPQCEVLILIFSLLYRDMCSYSFTLLFIFLYNL